MNEILNQLGGLVLGAVPTMVLILLLVVGYGLLVRRPLEHVLNDRRARTTGAVEQAQNAIAEAEARTTEYEDKLRKARADILTAREQKLKQWSTERDHALSDARAVTVEKVKAAKSEIEQSVAIAQLQIDGTSAELSEQVLRAVMPPGTRPEAAQ
ncbi:MAG TPA: ATP synthase F0 subunit B [Acidobacteriaceae bacterium]|jgi:F-type H+-transporting ATPase subunit b|nr:ATP synthase F0 subunit B [Acidobacteriaceae bacterium]